MSCLRDWIFFKKKEFGLFAVVVVGGLEDIVLACLILLWCAVLFGRGYMLF